MSKATSTEQLLMTIPGVGIKTAQDYILLNIQKVAELKDRNPSLLYEQLCIIKGTRIDRCELYQLRCAVYYASNTIHQPELLKWWNWKDRKYPTEK